MKEGYKILAVIPAYNEGEKIRHILSTIKKAAPAIDLCLVDDGSTDHTYQEAQKEDVILIRHPYNMGYAPACQSGFIYASENGYDIVLQIDADGQHEPKDIPAIITPVRQGTCDICIGSRFLNGGKYRTSFAKRMGMRIFSVIATVLTRQKITDPTSGFLAFNRNVLSLYCSDIYPDDYPDANLIVILHLAGLKVLEVPVRMYPNYKKSMHSFFSSLFYIFEMLLYISVSLFSRRYILSKLKQEKGKAYQ
jgi:glycosyltransferase involved in cell wall biosynthesis